MAPPKSSRQTMVPQQPLPDKENLDLHLASSKNLQQTKRRGRRMIPLQPSRLSLSLEEELEALTQKLNQMSVEKAHAEMLLEEKEVRLKEAEAQLELRGQKQEGLQNQLRKLQRKKAFEPTLTLPLQQSLGQAEPTTKKAAASKIKRPATAFIKWCNEHRQQVKEENKNASFQEMSAILGEKWKSVPEEEKKAFEDRYHAERKVYLELARQEKRDIEALNLFHEEQQKKTAMVLLEQYLDYRKESDDFAKKKQSLKDPLKPKQPITSFFAFCSQRRLSLLAEKRSIPEIGKILGDEWKNMTSEMRAPYEKIALQAKEQYTQELEAYKKKQAEEASFALKEEQQHREIERAQALQLLKQKEKIKNLKKVMREHQIQKRQLKSVNFDPNKPKRPPTSFLLFSKDTRKELLQEKPTPSFSEMTAIISVRWKELGEPEKKIWADKAAKAMEQYKKDMADYKKPNCSSNGTCPSVSEQFDAGLGTEREAENVMLTFVQ